MREQLKELTKQYDKSENDLKALQSVGQVSMSKNLFQIVTSGRHFVELMEGQHKIIQQDRNVYSLSLCMVCERMDLQKCIWMKCGLRVHFVSFFIC